MKIVSKLLPVYPTFCYPLLNYFPGFPATLGGMLGGGKGKVCCCVIGRYVKVQERFVCKVFFYGEGMGGGD